jgi:hypothetical protein
MTPQPAVVKVAPPKFNPLLTAGLLAAAAVVVFAVSIQWIGLTMNVTLSNLANLLAPVAFAAAVVERAVEILISPWRDTGANKLKKVLAAVQARPDSVAKEADEQFAAHALQEYRGVTQQYAFAASLLLSLCVSISGVRALQPFLDTNALAGVSAAQRGFFLTVDVALTALVLAGGADGVHSIVSAVTTFFDSSAVKSEKSAAQA